MSQFIAYKYTLNNQIHPVSNDPLLERDPPARISRIMSHYLITFQVVSRHLFTTRFRDLCYTTLGALVFTGILISDLVHYLVYRCVNGTSQSFTVPLLYAQTLLLFYAMGCYHRLHFCRKFFVVPHMKGFAAHLFIYSALLLFARLVLEVVFRSARPEYYQSSHGQSDVQLNRYAGLGS